MTPVAATRRRALHAEATPPTEDSSSATTVVRVLLGLGWTVHVLSWSYAPAKVRPGAANGDEWPREAFIRVAMVGLLLYSLLAAGGGYLPVARWLMAACVLGFWAGQMLAVQARLELGAAWGIGTRARSTGPAGPHSPAAAVVARGAYRFVAHPIYAGTFTALLMQTLLLQNAASLLLLAGAAAVIPWKIVRENRWIPLAR